MKKLVLLFLTLASSPLVAMQSKKTPLTTTTKVATYTLVTSQPQKNEPLSPAVQKSILWEKVACKYNSCCVPTSLSAITGIMSGVMGAVVVPSNPVAIAFTIVGCSGALFGGGVMAGMGVAHSEAVDVIEGRNN